MSTLDRRVRVRRADAWVERTRFTREGRSSTTTRVVEPVLRRASRRLSPPPRHRVRSRSPQAFGRLLATRGARRFTEGRGRARRGRQSAVAPRAPPVLASVARFREMWLVQRSRGFAAFPHGRPGQSRDRRSLLKPNSGRISRLRDEFRDQAFAFPEMVVVITARFVSEAPARAAHPPARCPERRRRAVRRASTRTTTRARGAP